MFGIDILLGASLFAYGPAPGVELIPQFLALVAWAGMAFFAILLAPLTALLRRLRKPRDASQADKPAG